MDRFDTDLKQNRPHLAKKKVLFHDNAWVHTCVVTMAKIHITYHSPYTAYSLGLGACDFLFPILKKRLSGKRFGSNKEVITETNAYFEGLEETYCFERKKQFEKRWTKGIELKEDYVEK